MRINVSRWIKVCILNALTAMRLMLQATFCFRFSMDLISESMCLPDMKINNNNKKNIPDASLNETVCFFCLSFCFPSSPFQTDTNKSKALKVLTQVHSNDHISSLLVFLDDANDKACCGFSCLYLCDFRWGLLNRLCLTSLTRSFHICSLVASKL